MHLGELAAGNRLLVLGDSILEATSTRFGGAMCEQLVPSGWAVQIDAENGRDAGVALDVVNDRVAQGEEWDAAVVMLGNNYRDDPQQFAQQLDAIVNVLAPAPVLLLTVTEFEPSRAEVNFVIREEADQHDGVQVLEWSERTSDDDTLVGADGLHPNDAGKQALTSMVGSALGPAPEGSVGACLDT